MGAIREEKAEVAGIVHRWLEAGHGWPVVLLHAFPVSAEMWRAQLDAVPDGFRFIAPELQSRSGEGIDGYARTAGALLDALDIDTAAIGGLSMGGYVTFALYRQLPERFSHMILADTRPQADTPEARAGRETLRRLAADAGAPAVADVMLPRLLSARARSEQPDVVSRVRAMIAAQPVAAIDTAIAAMLDRPDSTPDLARIGIPVLLAAGEDDELTPPDVMRDMETLLPRAQSAVIHDAGHLSNLERPSAFSRVLHDFLLAHI
jgi:pimeloyl-ACP methyl ester carboxylesterase